jgi:lipid-binding SYLF domain-containing protein
MRLRQFTVGTAMLALLIAGAALAQSKEDKDRAEIKDRSQESLQALLTEVPGSKALYDKAAGYAVFATTKAVFIVTGGGGSGITVDKASGKTVFMKMGMGGVGFGVGAQKYDMIILFETPTRLQTFIDGGWDSAAAAKAVAGSDSAGAGSGFIDGTIIYTLGEKGLMASADVSGTRFWVDEDLN